MRFLRSRSFEGPTSRPGWGIENLANVERLPRTGAAIVVGALKCKAGRAPANGCVGPDRRDRRPPVITCYLTYRIDPYKSEEFEDYARLWLRLVPRFGGTHHGYFLP